uniref:Retrotransposon gag domain-containing protein n=1 Tax=Photinus pyralis TaxID=7054 RepID=A0A1Y1MYE7_PHOPY
MIMEKLFKPDKFSSNPDSPTAQQEWLHWIRLFENFTERSEYVVKDEDQLQVLSNFLSSNVFEYINDCTTYQAAIDILKALYVKPKNLIYARHQLATRKQLSTESIDQYLTALKSLAKECHFKAVSAEQNKQDYIRDAFIAGLFSSNIRQRLLENKSLELDEAEEKARSIERAIKKK